MRFQELKAAALPDLAIVAADAAAEIAARLAAFETLAARVSEIADSWSGFTARERAALRAAFDLDADAMARRGFITAADVRRADYNRKHFGTIAQRKARAKTVAALCT